MDGLIGLLLGLLAALVVLAALLWARRPAPPGSGMDVPSEVPTRIDDGD